jgi:hypothetical protein
VRLGVLSYREIAVGGGGRRKECGGRWKVSVIEGRRKGDEDKVYGKERE